MTLFLRAEQGKKEEFGIKLIDLICSSSNMTQVVSYTIIEEMPHPFATNRLFATKERMPVAIESGVTDLPMFRKTVIIALDSMTCPAVP